MIEMDETKSRSYYPWDELTSVGEEFKTSNLHARQLVYAKNKANLKKGRGERFKAKKDPMGYYLVERVM